MKRIGFSSAMFFCLLALAYPVSAEPKGTLKVAVMNDLMGLPPLEHTSTGQMMHRHIFDSLVDFDTNGVLLPRLAESWELINETTWRFRLRKGVVFHNGFPFTAADAKFSIEYQLDPEKKWAARVHFASVDRVEIVDDHTVDIKTKAPDPVLPNAIAGFLRIASKKVFAETGEEGLRSKAIGTGPFKFVSWKRNDQLTLEANAQWYMEQPRVKNLVFRVIPEMGARAAELRAGGVHIIADVPPFMASEIKQGKDADIHTVLTNRGTYMLLDTKKVEQLKNKKVRQALNHAVDKEAIVKALFQGMATPLGTHAAIPVAKNTGELIAPYPYDPEKAKSLLKEAGYESGLSLDLYSPSGRYPMDKEVVLAIADQLSKVGIKTNVHIMESNTYLGNLVAQKLGGGAYYIGMYAATWDINFFLNQLVSDFVACFYPSETIDAMVAKTRVMMKQQERMREAHRILELVHEEAPYLFLYNGMPAYGVSKNVKGFVPRSEEFMDLWKVSLAE